MTALDVLKLTDKRKEICKKLDLKDVEDILSYYPMRYEMTRLNKKEEFIKGARVCFKGKIITTTTLYRFGAKRSMVRFKCLDQYGDEINCTIFNRPWAATLKPGQELYIVGTLEAKDRMNVINYYYPNKKDQILGIKPVYGIKEGVSQYEIRTLIAATLNKMKDHIIEVMPDRFIKAHDLISFEEALIAIHMPEDIDSYKRALARLKYQEFLYFYLALFLRQGEVVKKAPKSFDMGAINRLINSLNFTLTKDQLSTIKEILIDLKSERTMTRLVQGDVGSGKTIVAIIALYANHLAGYQGAFMAPTEILARQHYENLVELLEPLGVKIALLTSSIKKEKEIKDRLAHKEIDIVVGTHALFSDDVKMCDLGLVITDEQQRFGVNQRKKLLAKGDDVDFLLMSATPIPRTLASALYGDMAISSIYTMPEGRKGCDTRVIYQNDIKEIVTDLIATLDSGRQIYIIASAIDHKEGSELQAATELHDKLQSIFAPYVVGLLHGRLSNETKEDVMRDFASDQIQVLVTTTVVEVGVNVPNATCMAVYDAERFGLSQLHQLRGRIQRSVYRGSFYLLCDEDVSEDVKKRLEVLCNTNDGFKIAEEDLKLRGPGDILGTRQSGLPSFILGDLFNDRIIIDAAQKDARAIISQSQRTEFHDILKQVKQGLKESLN